MVGDDHVGSFCLQVLPAAHLEAEPQQVLHMTDQEADHPGRDDGTRLQASLCSYCICYCVNRVEIGQKNTSELCSKSHYSCLIGILNKQTLGDTCVTLYLGHTNSLNRPVNLCSVNMMNKISIVLYCPHQLR